MRGPHCEQTPGGPPGREAAGHYIHVGNELRGGRTNALLHSFTPMETGERAWGPPFSTVEMSEPNLPNLGSIRTSRKIWFAANANAVAELATTKD